MKWIPQTFKIVYQEKPSPENEWTHDVIKEKEIEGVVGEGTGLGYKRYQGVEGGFVSYVIIHLPSGVAIPVDLTVEQDARNCIEFLSQVDVDWTLPQCQIPAVHCSLHVNEWVETMQKKFATPQTIFEALALILVMSQDVLAETDVVFSQRSHFEIEAKAYAEIIVITLDDKTMIALEPSHEERFPLVSRYTAYQCDDEFYEESTSNEEL